MKALLMAVVMVFAGATIGCDGKKADTTKPPVKPPTAPAKVGG